MSRRGSLVEKKGVSSIVVIAVVAVIAVVTTGIVLYLATRGGEKHSINIVNPYDLIPVNAGSYKEYSFTVPSGAKNAHVVGSFIEATGNDIIVLIMDWTAFVNWQTGHQVSFYYSSGQLTTSDFDVSLPADKTIYVVYSNTLSLTGKTVISKVDLNYTM